MTTFAHSLSPRLWQPSARSYACCLLLTTLGCSASETNTQQDASVNIKTDAGVSASNTDVLVSQDGGASQASDFTRPKGLIAVTTWFESNETALAATFDEGPTPAFHVETQRTGSCRIVANTPSFCAPACTEGGLCLDGMCQAFPKRKDLGPIDWTWPGGRKVVVASNAKSYYATGESRSVGEVVVSVDKFVLKAQTGYAPMPSSDWDKALETRRSNEKAVRLTWTNVDVGSRVRVRMTDCTGSHGGVAKKEIECEAPDTGELAIPHSFLDQLDAGDWGRGECGVHTLERYRRTTPQNDDSIRLETIAPTRFFYRPDRR